MKDSIDALEPHLEDVTRAVHPLRRLSGRGRRPETEPQRTGVVRAAPAARAPARARGSARRRARDRRRLRRGRALPSRTPARLETAEKPVKLPDGWHRYVNKAGGFELGLPRGWKANERGTTASIRSFDELVVMSIAPDRTNEALESDLGEFAAGTLASLRGYEGSSTPSKPQRSSTSYDAVEVRSKAKSKAVGVKQDVSVIVLRAAEAGAVHRHRAANAKARGRAGARRPLSPTRSRPDRSTRPARPRRQPDEAGGLRLARPVRIDVVDRRQRLERGAELLRRSPRLRPPAGRPRRPRRPSRAPARASARSRRSSSLRSSPCPRPRGTSSPPRPGPRPSAAGRAPCVSLRTKKPTRSSPSGTAMAAQASGIARHHRPADGRRPRGARRRGDQLAGGPEPRGPQQRPARVDVVLTPLPARQSHLADHERVLAQLCRSASGGRVAAKALSCRRTSSPRSIQL